MLYIQTIQTYTSIYCNIFCFVAEKMRRVQAFFRFKKRGKEKLARGIYSVFFSQQFI